MKIQTKVGFILVVLAAMLLAGAVLLGFVPGVGARVTMADSVRHFSLLARTMPPIDSSIGYNSSDAYLRTVQESTMRDNTAYAGQVDLPDGATVVGVRAFGLDSDPFFEYCFGLSRYSLDDDPAWTLISDWVCSGESFQGGKIELDAPVHAALAMVDNEQYSYSIFLVLPTPYNPPYQDLGVLRFVVDTSYGTQLPLVQNNWSEE